MPKFTIHWTEELWYRMDVEAASEDEALDRFHAGDYDFDEARNTDVQMQDSVYVEEVK
jgi:hypothetical protein